MNAAMWVTLKRSFYVIYTDKENIWKYDVFSTHQSTREMVRQKNRQ